MPQLTPPEIDAWRAYIEGSLRLNTRIDEDLKASAGMTLFDYHILVLLAEVPHRRLRMHELAERMVFAPSRLTYQVKQMEEKGLIKRERCEDDARGWYAAITREGIQALRRATPAHAESIRRHLLDGLDADDVGDLGRIFSRIRSRLEPARDAEPAGRRV